ncbi:proline/glycine betaine ABC transporter permease, partial [Mycobacterium sp. KBS0706]
MFSADDLYVLPVDKWIQAGVQWMSQNLRPFFQLV